MKPLLLQQVKEDLRALRLRDMAENLDAALQHADQQSHLSFLAQLVQHQRAAVKNRSFDRRLQKAQLPRNMTFEIFDWTFQPGLPVEQIRNLQDLNFVTQRHPVIFLGKTGTGKTHMATALGILACEAGFKVQFFTLQHLLASLYATLADDTTDERIATLSRLDLLIIDHVGYIRTKPEYPSLLFDLINACDQKVSVILTTNISLQDWTQALGNVSIAHAIIDRILDHAHIINIRKGRSYRSQGPHAPQIQNIEQTAD